MYAVEIIKKLSRAQLFPLIFGLIAAFPVDSWAQQGRYNDWHPGYGMMHGWGFGGIGMIVWILLIVGVFILIKWIVQTVTGGNAKSKQTPYAMDILKQRYAKGEIDKARFESMKKDII
jgi:putative membrane protein